MQVDAPAEDNDNTEEEREYVVENPTLVSSNPNYNLEISAIIYLGIGYFVYKT